MKARSSYFMRHSQGSAGHKNGMLHQVCWFRGKWSGEGKLRLLDKWTYRGRFLNRLPIGKGIFHYKKEVRFEGRWSNAETAIGKIYGLEKAEMVGRIRGGEIQTKKGILSKSKPAGSFDCRRVLSEGKIG